MVKTRGFISNLNPVWNERIEMGLYEKDVAKGELEISLYECSGDRFGTAKLPLSQIPRNSAKEFNFNVRMILRR
jgi:Ca2+-dependent lipid-binding protein